MRRHFGGEEDLLAWNSRSTDRIGAGLLIAVRASGIDMAVPGSESVEGDGLGDVCGSVEISLGLYRHSYEQKARMEFHLGGYKADDNWTRSEWIWARIVVDGP